MNNYLADLLFDLEVYMEVAFQYAGKRYTISYDKDFAYLSDSQNELAKVNLSDSHKLIDKKIIGGLSVRDIWDQVKIINM